MTAIHELRKLQCQNVKEINFVDETPSITGGCINRFDWAITGICPGFDLNGQLNGQFVEFTASLKTDPENPIYGVRDLKAFILTNTGADPSNEFTDGELHSATVTGEIPQFMRPFYLHVACKMGTFGYNL